MQNKVKKRHYFRRFALLLALTPTVRTPGLDPAGANGGPHPSLRWQSSDRAQQFRRSISRLSGGLPTSMLPLTRSVCRGFWSDSTHGKQGLRHQPPPEIPGGEGWLVSPEQQLVCQFKPDSATVHAQWVAVRTYRWVPPRPPVPQTRRRMLRHNAVEAWDKMLRTGWHRCRPPVR